MRIFPLHSPADTQDHSGFDLELRADHQGRLLSVKARNQGTPPAGNGAIDTLILDLGIAARATPPTITALRFTAPTGMPAYTAQVWLEASDDLQRWRPLGTADLQWLQAADGAMLACDTLAFEATPLRFARITWRGGSPAVFAGISAVSVDERQVPPELDSVLLAPSPGRTPGDLVYAAGISIPAERAALQFSAPNMVYTAMLGGYFDVPQQQGNLHRHHTHHHLRERLHAHLHHLHGHAHRTSAAPVDWFVPLASATFYDIDQDGKRRRSGGVALPDTRLAQWVVRPYSQQALPLAQAPRLQLSWQPAALLFLANGNGPYTLAVGRAEEPAMRHDIGHIAPGYTDEELRALPQAVAATAHPAAATVQGLPGGAAAGGSAANAAGAATGNARGTITGSTAPGATAVTPASSPGRNAALWGVLVAGVAVLAYLTLRLLKKDD